MIKKYLINITPFISYVKEKLPPKVTLPKNLRFTSISNLTCQSRNLINFISLKEV